MSLLWHILLQMLIGSQLCIVPFWFGLNGTYLSAASPLSPSRFSSSCWEFRVSTMRVSTLLIAEDVQSAWGMCTQSLWSLGKRRLGDAWGFQGTLLFPSVNGIPGWPAPQCSDTRQPRDGRCRVQMLLISIRRARRDHPVILKRKICSKKHYLTRQVWKETAVIFGKEKEKSQRNESKDRKRKMEVVMK